MVLVFLNLGVENTLASHVKSRPSLSRLAKHSWSIYKMSMVCMPADLPASLSQKLPAAVEVFGLLNFFSDFNIYILDNYNL
jgi:hypothetical protein